MKEKIYTPLTIILILLVTGCQYFSMMPLKDWQDNNSFNPQKALKYVGEISGNGLGHVHGMTIDSLGNIYVSDNGNSRIMKFNQNGDYLLQFGNGLLSGQKGIAADSNDNIYIVDTGNNNIKKFDAAGNYISTFSHSSSSLDLAAVDKSGNLYVTDYNAPGHVYIFNNDGVFQKELGNTSLFTSAVAGVAVDSSGYIFISSDGLGKIFIFDPNGNYLSSITAINPNGIAVDDCGNVYDATNTQNSFIVYDKNGNQKLKIGGSASSAPGLFNQPVDVKVDSYGNVYIADYANNRVQIFRWSSN
jgi:streptogramin lyase